MPPLRPLPPPPTPPDIARGARAAHVYRRLHELIVRGRLPPGARVVEQEVAIRLGVGRTPVREALQLLVQEGYLVTGEGGRRQLTVAPLRADDVAELFTLVADLEAAAVRELDALSPRERASLATTLRATNALLGEVVARAPLDLERAFALHQAFHTTLTDRLAGRRLAWLLSLVRPQIERYEWVYGVLLEGELGVAILEHDAIVRAVAAGDAAAAEAALRTNWRNASHRLRAVIQRLGERGAW